MSGILARWYWRHKRLMMFVAALPLFQATGTCDLTALNSFITQQFLSATFNLLVGSTQQVLLQNFPSADILQTLLGGNRQPFFTM